MYIFKYILNFSKDDDRLKSRDRSIYTIGAATNKDRSSKLKKLPTMCVNKRKLRILE